MAYKDLYFPSDDLLWNVPNDWADDLGPQGRTLTFNGSVSLTGGDHLVFNGTNNWLDVTGGGVGQFDVWDFTIENIIRFANLTGTQYLFTNNFGTPGTTLKVYLAAGVIKVEIGGVVKATFTPTAGVDYNWAVCRMPDNTMRFFVNGVQQGASWTNTDTFNEAPYRLGADSAGANRFSGNVYGARVTFEGRYAADYTAATPASLVDGDWPNYVIRIAGTITAPDGSPGGYKVRAVWATDFNNWDADHVLPAFYMEWTGGTFSFSIRRRDELVVIVQGPGDVADDLSTIRNHKILRVNPRA